MMTGGQPINYELAIENLPLSQFSSFITDHPHVINTRFWHGQTALHKLCLRQDSTVEALNTLIVAGADVNAVNNYGETPLMFSAKRGSSTFCQLLIDSGADQAIYDKAGRQVIHHAVMGGSVYLVHFLYTVFNCNLDAEDTRKQTSLHVASSQGNLCMVNYLLRSNRCDSKKADVFGNTALHHASIYGHEQVVYALLSNAGLSMLDSVNENRLTPQDACTAKGSKHLATSQVFKYAYEQKSRGNNMLQPPRGLWFWYLIMPLTFFVAGISASEILQLMCGWYSGNLLMGPVLLYILYLFQVHSHRIKHHSRLPNPMHAGAFGAGLIGTLIAWIVAVFPKLSLSDDYINLTICVCVLMCAPTTYYFYWLLLVSDPGFIALPDKGAPTPSAVKLAMQCGSSEARFCRYCDLVASGYVKHCKLCERCVVNMDHHCLFLMKCVATYNHRLFTMFIIVVNIDIILFLLSTYKYFTQLYAHHDISSFLSQMATEHLVMFYIIILNLFSAIWGLFLLQWQLRLIGRGFTYYETLSHGTETSDTQDKLGVRDSCLNLIKFFRGDKSPLRRNIRVV